MMRVLRVAAALVLMTGLITGMARAQSTTGTISGTVKDSTGAILPGVTVNIKHLQTSQVRGVDTSTDGRFRATSLAVGDYELTAQLQGFKTEVRSGITLTLGREAVIDFTLQLGDIGETISVTAEAPLVDTSSGIVGGLVDEKTISELPLSGRDFIQLALLEPSVMRITNTDNVISKGFGTRTSFAGSRPRQNIFLMDGANVNNFTNFAVPGSVAGVVLGVDTVREFQVLVGSYGAEYAGAGGTLSAITKSGSNEFHGNAFWFTRNDELDSKNYFDRVQPNFSRNQFGGTFGGPVKRDRLFFFGSVEGLRDRLGVTNIGIVPDVNARQGYLPDRANPGQLTFVGVNPRVKPYLDLNPLPNGRTFGDGFAEHIWSAEEPTDQRYFVGKLDARYGKAHSVFVRYTLDDSDTLRRQSLPLFVSQWSNKSQWLTAENRLLLSANHIFVFRASWVQSGVRGDDIVAEGQTFDPNLSFIAGKPMGTATFVPSRDSSAPRINTANSYQFNAQMVSELGRHSVKYGADLYAHYLQFVGVSHIYGNYFFDSLQNFLLNRPVRLQFRTGSDPRPERDVRMFVGGFYLQDDFRATDRLTFNLGLRYEPYGVPRETKGLESTLKNALDPAYTVGSQVIRNPSLKNFGPRLGFAWDMFGDGRWSVRGGVGLYHDVLLPMIYRNVFSGAPPFSNVLNVDNPTNFPDVLADARIPGRAVLTNPDGIEYNVTQPRIYQGNLQIEGQIAQTIVASIGYVGSRGFNQVRMMDGNTAIPTIQADGTKFFPTNSVRRNPNFAGSWWRLTDGESQYDGLRAKLNKRFSDGLMFGLAYSLGYAFDDGSTDVGQTDFQSNASLPQDPDDKKAFWGPSNFDVRHNFTANFSAEVPWGKNWTGLSKYALAGWQVNGIIALASGTPFSPLLGFDNARNRSRAFSQMPNLVPGCDANPILGGPDRYFDVNCFSLPAPGTYGNAKRNSMRSAGIQLVDVSLVKNIGPAEIRVEVFNALNRANFGRPNATVFDSGGRVGSAGRITSTSTPARQVQLGVKYTF